MGIFSKIGHWFKHTASKIGHDIKNITKKIGHDIEHPKDIIKDIEGDIRKIGHGKNPFSGGSKSSGSLFNFGGGSDPFEDNGLINLDIFKQITQAGTGLLKESETIFKEAEKVVQETPELIEASVNVLGKLPDFIEKSTNVLEQFFTVLYLILEELLKLIKNIVSGLLWLSSPSRIWYVAFALLLLYLYKYRFKN